MYNIVIVSKVLMHVSISTSVSIDIHYQSLKVVWFHLFFP